MSTLMRRGIILVTLLFFAGCEARKPTAWKIVITSPAGESKSYEVQSYEKPVPLVTWGGQTMARDLGSSGMHDWERQIVAPTGWRLEVESISSSAPAPEE